MQVFIALSAVLGVSVASVPNAYGKGYGVRNPAVLPYGNAYGAAYAPAAYGNARGAAYAPAAYGAAYAPAAYGAAVAPASYGTAAPAAYGKGYGAAVAPAAYNGAAAYGVAGVPYGKAKVGYGYAQPTGVIIGGARGAGAAYNYKNGENEAAINGQVKYEQNAGYGWATENDASALHGSVWSRSYDTQQASQWGSKNPQTFKVQTNKYNGAYPVSAQQLAAPAAAPAPEAPAAAAPSEEQ